MFWDFIESLLNLTRTSTNNQVDNLRENNQNFQINSNRVNSQSQTTIQNHLGAKPKRIKNIYFKDLENEKPKVEFTREKKTELENLIKDLQDPLSGEPLRVELGKNLYTCKNCLVIYLQESYEYIVQYNDSKCVSCGHRAIEVLKYYEKTKINIFSYNPNIVTLNNLKDHVNKSIKFTGTIVKILESKRGDYALMFEDKPWVEGFKLIVFYPLMKPGRGLEREFLQSLVGKKITVRGILQKHEIYGYEILIFKRSMILDIK